MELALNQSGTPSFSGVFAKIAEALAGAGCAGFFVLATVLGLEVTAENARQLAQPSVKISVGAVGALASMHWEFAPSAAPSPVLAVRPKAPTQAPALGKLQDRLAVAMAAPAADASEREAVLSFARKVREGRDAALEPPAGSAEPRLERPEYSAPGTPIQQGPQEGPAYSGWVVAGQQLVFPAGPMRPREVIFMAPGVLPVRVAVAADGRAATPAASSRATEYSFRAPTRRSGPALLGLISQEGLADRQLDTQAAVEVGAALAGELDFRKLSAVAIRGRVFEAGETSPLPIVGAEVQLAGDPSRVAITDAQGFFDLGVLQVPAGAKAFVEATRPGGFKHRFEVSTQGGDTATQDLFVFSDEQIQEWSEAFEGGLSPDSGWVVTAATDWGPARRDAKLAVEMTAVGRPLEPETYALDTNNAIRPQGARSRGGASRWLSVELPEGSARVGLKAPQGEWLRSSWTPVSPGVISVILLDDAK